MRQEPLGLAGLLTIASYVLLTGYDALGFRLIRHPLGYARIALASGANPKSVAAIIMEPVVGTNGIVIPPKNYMKGLRQLCDENGILLVIDEVMAAWKNRGAGPAFLHLLAVPGNADVPNIPLHHIEIKRQVMASLKG